MSQQTMLNFSTKRKPLADVDVNPRPPKREFKNVTASSSAVPEPPPEPSASVDTLHRLDDIAALVRAGASSDKVLESVDRLAADLRAARPLPAWPAPSPVEHLNYSLVPRVVDTKTYIFDTIWERFEALHVAAPSHPIFGEVAPGVLRAPFRARMGKGAPTSWLLRMHSYADSVAKRMGSQITPGSCWILDRQDTTIQRKLPTGKAETLVNYKHHRLLAFLRHGSPAAWSALNDGTPGLHFCHNGMRKGRIWLCTNGVQHVQFGCADDNNKQRACAGLDRARCPGHGPGLDRCIYVWLEHDDEKLVGVPRPCLNGNEVPPRACEHVPSCF